MLRAPSACPPAKKARIDEHSGFVDALLCLMKNSAESSGTQTGSRISENIGRERIHTSDYERVAKTRFALGADDGAYLRQAVMPLQTLFEENTTDDAFSMGATNSTLSPMETGRRGLLNALEAEMAVKKEKAISDLKVCLEHAAWLLSIQEVWVFCKFMLEQQPPTTSRDNQLELLQTFFTNNADLAMANYINVDVDKSEDLESRKNILSTILLIFGKSTDLVKKQFGR